jgi:hypothetical protein
MYNFSITEKLYNLFFRAKIGSANLYGRCLIRDPECGGSKAGLHYEVIRNFNKL